MFTQKLNVNEANRCKQNSFISFFCSIISCFNKALFHGVFCDFVFPGSCGVSM